MKATPTVLVCRFYFVLRARSDEQTQHKRPCVDPPHSTTATHSRVCADIKQQKHQNRTNTLLFEFAIVMENS